MMSGKVIHKYFEFPDGRKEWAVTGDCGSISFWIDKGYIRDFTGGIETHYTKKTKPNYLTKSNSYHKKCMINGGECYHDGSSLQAYQHWIPNILPLGQDEIFRELKKVYLERFKEQVND